jgi:hypothetical protein
MPDAAEQQPAAIETNTAEQQLTADTDPTQIPLPPSPSNTLLQLELPMAPTHAPIPRTDGKPEAKHRPKKVRVAPMIEMDDYLNTKHKCGLYFAKLNIL